MVEKTETQEGYVLANVTHLQSGNIELQTEIFRLQ